MKKIQLTKGKFALLDDDDFNWINHWKWQAHKNKTGKTFYATRTKWINGKSIGVKMHRLILGVSDSKILTDHKDGNGLNNQRSNLRIASPSQNISNVRRKSKNGYIGITASRNGWQARITNNYKTISLGVYKNKIDAAKAYDEAAKNIKGEFAALNFAK